MCSIVADGVTFGAPEFSGLLKAWLAALIFTWFILEPSEIMSGVCFSNMSQYRCCRPLVRCRAKCKELGLEKIDITSFL